MHSVSFIICSAGQGMRMKSITDNIPKHLLYLQNRRLLEWSLSSLPFRKNDQLILIAQHNKEFDKISDSILRELENTHKISTQAMYIEHTTEGQAATALLAQKIVKYPRIALFNSDTYFACSELDRTIHDLDYFGCAPCFQTAGDEWSFFKTKGLGPHYSVIDVEEKKRISDWCSTGFYFFKDGHQFFDKVELSIAKKSYEKELYIAPLYKHFLHLDVAVLNCEIFQPMGTPKQAEHFWNTTLQEMKQSTLKE